MLRTCFWAVTVAVLATLGSQAADPSKCTIKPATTAVPKELADPIRALLSDSSVQVLDDQGKLYCEFWFRKEFAAKGTADDLKKGVNYRKLDEATIFGAVRFAQPWQSFRKQDLKGGLYTLRLGFQPMDGDHQGTAPYNEFLVLSPAAVDRKAGLMPHKELTEMSGKSIAGSTHPVVLLLYPNPKPDDAPQLANKGNGIWVLSNKSTITAGSEKGVLGLGVTLFGVTTAE